MAENKQTAGETAIQQVFTYNFSDVPIRLRMKGDTVWFVAKDVCKALNITWSGATLAQIPDEWKGVLNFNTPGGNQELTCISEAGMYKLAFRCQSSKVADDFTNKVASEILPSIRKTGRYGIAPRAPKALRKPRVKPRDRSAELGVFFRELRLWVRSSDVDETAAMMGVGRSHVLQVLGGTKPGVDVLEILVAYAKENREKGKLTDIRNVAQAMRRTSELTEQLRIDFMDGYTCIGKEGGAL